MRLEIVTPEGKFYEGEVKSVRVPGVKGSFQILRDHAPIISTLEEGEVHIDQGAGKYRILRISGGVVEVKMNRITLLAESAT